MVLNWRLCGHSGKNVDIRDPSLEEEENMRREAWRGVEKNGVERRGGEWSGVEWSGVVIEVGLTFA